MGSTNDKNGNDALFVVLGVASGVLAIVLLIGFYIPVILLGLPIGIILFHPFYHKTWSGRICGYLFGLGFFATVYFLLIGLPVISNGRFTGLAYLVFDDNVTTFARSLVSGWNSFLMMFKAKGAVVFLPNVRPETIAQYVWVSLIVAAGFPFVILAYVMAKDRASFYEKRGWSGPAKIFEKVILNPLSFWWFQKGRLTSVLKGSVIKSFLYSTVSLFVLWIVSNAIWEDSRHLEFRIMGTYLAAVPFFSWLSGFLFGFFRHGNKLVDLITGQNIIFSEKKPPCFELGMKENGGRAFLTEQNLAYHVDMNAPTGSGKTSLIKKFIHNRIERGHGVIFLDFKAEFDGVTWLYGAAKASGREGDIRVLSLAHPEMSIPYNPIKYGDKSDIHSTLMNALIWSDPYYRSIGSVALMTVVSGLCEYRDKTQELFHLGHIYELFTEPAKLRVLASYLTIMGSPTTGKINQLAAKLDKPGEQGQYGGLIAGLDQLLNSAAGNLMSRDAVHGTFDFKDAIENKRIVYMLMNSLKLKESATVVGRLILQDLMRYVGDKYSMIEKGAVNQTSLVIDEFANFATPEFIEFMDRARGAGIGIIMAHQARADLRAISPEFQERVEANANTIIVSGVKTKEDAEYYAGMLGTKTVKKKTEQVKTGFIFDTPTGMKSVRDVEEYVLHPNRLRNLNQGELFVMSKTVDPDWGIVRFDMPRAFEREVESTAVVNHLHVIREEYMEQGDSKYLNLNVAPASVSTAEAVAPQPTDQEPETWN